ncbi:MAG: PilZ domain-containing protein [Planctomycetes bacterium]|nr:PilZ domain-containing protein [Planctomycetota bacterium]
MIGMLGGPIGVRVLAGLGLEGILRALRLPRPSPEFLLWIGLACTVLFGLLLGTDSLRTWARRRAARRRLSDRLRQAAARAALDREEAVFLARTLATENMPRAVRALESSRAFGTVVDRTIARLRAEGEDPSGALRVFSSIRRKLGLDRPRPGVPIASTRELSPGLGMEVSAGVGEERFHWAATLLAIDEERLVLRLDDAVRALPNGGLLLRDGITIGPGDELSFYFWREGDAGYHFQKRVVETRLRGAGLVVIEHARSLERRQNREFVRVKIDVTFLYRRIPARIFSKVVGSEDRLSGSPPLRARLIDLSGGGLRLRASQPFDSDDVIAIEPPFISGLDARQPLYARCVGRGPYPDGSYAFAFTGIGEALRDRIVGFVYRIERERLRGREAFPEAFSEAFPESGKTVGRAEAAR